MATGKLRLGGGEEKVGIDDADAEGAEGLVGVEVVDGVGGDLNAGRLPELHDVGGDPIIPHSDEFDARGGGEVENVFWGPIGVAVESEEDGAPRVDGHDPVEHLGMIDLDDEAIEEGGVDGGGGGDEGFELAADGGLVDGFGISDDIKIGILLHEAEELGEVGGVILVGNEAGEEVGAGEGLGLIGGGLAPSGWVVGEDEVVVVGDGEIDLKDAVAEGIVEERSVGGVSVGVAVDAAESVGDIGVLGPRIVELVSGGNGWIGGAGRAGGGRVIYWGWGDYLEDQKGAEAEQREDGADDGDEGGARETRL